MRNNREENDLGGSLPSWWRDGRKGPGGFWWVLGLAAVLMAVVVALVYSGGGSPETWWKWAQGLAAWPLVFAWNFAGFFVGGFVWPLGGGEAEGGNGGMIWVGGLLLNWGVVAWLLAKLVGRIFRGGGSQGGGER